MFTITLLTMAMENLSDVRRELKAIGFKVKTETFSWGRSATYTDLLKNNRPTVYYGDIGVNSLAYWKPLNDFILANKSDLETIGWKEEIKSLTFH